MRRLASLLLFLSIFIIASDAYTPPKGSNERVAIMDALRVEVKSYDKIDVVFKVQYLKIKNGWAWIHAMPISKDGKNNYEDISALLHNKKGLWKVAEIACTEIETQGCIDDPNYFRDLKKKFPQVPDEIFVK